MFDRAPNGYFVRDLIVFNHLRSGGYVSKGFVFEAPDLTNSPVVDLNSFQDQLCLLLASLNENQRLQVILTTRGNCCATNRRQSDLPISEPNASATNGSPG